ncbi:BPL-N domain-containing protein [Rhodopirellula halodulae]|uniref:BPL-N domain-containing protein n=1 Tax=Rhodopirellula halodulae TaxID=2894198 RepID=UPI001E571D33|nr:BPL-N domain-containing protein [Rhodopirellula sp. JC737]MCC9658511.1 BPL-N domain-containing protein [Rhodopirellula sp. JC737]
MRIHRHLTIHLPLRFVSLCFVGLGAWPCTLSHANEAIRVAIYNDNGVGQSWKSVQSNLTAEDQTFSVQTINAQEIRSGVLDDFDVLIHPGGSGSQQGKALQEAGRESVRKFVSDGGGYLGICAGAYLATNDYSWSLNLLDAKVVDRLHWNRGNGDVSISLTDQAATLFDCTDHEVNIYYAQGPLLGRREWDDPRVPDYESLAVFSTEIAKKGAPRGIMIGTSAAVRGEYDEGRVLCFSPHPELTEALGSWITIAVQWLACDQSRPEATPRCPTSARPTPGRRRTPTKNRD